MNAMNNMVLGIEGMPYSKAIKLLHCDCELQTNRLRAYSDTDYHRNDYNTFCIVVNRQIVIHVAHGLQGHQILHTSTRAGH